MNRGDEGENKRLIGNRMRSCRVKQSVGKRGIALVRCLGVACRGSTDGTLLQHSKCLRPLMPPRAPPLQHADPASTWAAGRAACKPKK